MPLLRSLTRIVIALTSLGSVGSGQAAVVPPSVLPGLGLGAVREAVDAGQPPWRGVVRVQTEIGLQCTGALIGPRVVLTAAHCLFGRGTGRLVRPASIHVLAGFSHGEYAGHARAVSVEIGLDADWALLTLDAPLGTADRVLKLVLQRPAVGTPAMLGGYEQDRAQIIVADVACSILGVVRSGDALLLHHSCAGTRGVSGAPLLVRIPGQGWGVVGIASIAEVGTSGGYAVPLPTAAARGGLAP